MEKNHHPLLKWAQRKDKVFLTLELRDLAEEKVELSETQIAFKAVSDGKHYEFNYQFCKQVNKQASKWNKTGFHMIFQLEKMEPVWWLRLVKDSKKNPYIQVDWDKWVDEDEEGEEGQKGLGGWDPNSMQGFGNDGEQEDSDDEPANLADLDEAKDEPAKTQ